MINSKDKQKIEWELNYLLLEAKKRLDEGDKDQAVASFSYVNAIGNAQMALNLVKTGVAHDSNPIQSAKSSPYNPFKHDTTYGRKMAYGCIQNAIREIQDLGFTVQEVL